MQLDQTRIPIRERSYLELLDLALHIVRRHGMALLFLNALGAAPWFVFNFWVLKPYAPHDVSSDSSFASDLFEYYAMMACLLVWELPMASAFATRYLGLALFVDRPRLGNVFVDVFKSLPQLVIVQLVLRGILTLFCVTWLVMFWLWPHMNEIILLERNPLFRGRSQPISTFSRCGSLHAYSSGELLSRWLMSLLVAIPWVAMLFLAMLFLQTMVTGEFHFGASIWVLMLPVVIWMVIGYFNVVRFLGYLDLRIRREGWEVELRMRAEGARLQQEMELEL
ncbi:MAG: hypothetical protein MPJ50_10880 [Pirellulales bacterium]|nr:hypothetical protein [Pirellulales bacterium]